MTIDFFLKAASELLREGFSVIPLTTRGKDPRVKWAKYHTDVPTEADLVAWWREYPMSNVGIVTGRVSNIVVVDVDPKRGGNYMSFLDRFPTDTIVRTGGGGYHLYYRYPTGVQHVPNRVDFEPGLDLRADGGLVVAPPSIHETGNEYAWVSKGRPSVLPNIFARDIIEQSKNERGWISDLMAKGAPMGQRNDACAKLAGYFASTSVPLDIATATILLWNERNFPPLPEKEVVKTVDSVYQTEHRRQQRAPDPTIASHLKNYKGFALMDFVSYMDVFADKGVDWTIQDWLPQSTIAFAISPPGSFKTWLTFDACISVATGSPFLGKFKVHDPGPVFLVQQEDYHGQTQNRLDIIARSKFAMGMKNVMSPDPDDFEMKMPPKIPIFIHPDRKLRFSDKTAIDGLEAAIADIRPKLVVIDPLYSAGDTTDYMAKTATQMLALKTFRDRYGCSFLVVHHTKKGADGEDRERLWGSSFLNAFIETGWQVSKVADAEIKVKRHFKSAPTAADTRIGFDIQTNNGKMLYLPIVKNADQVVFSEDPDDDEPAANKVRALASAMSGKALDARIMEFLETSGGAASPQDIAGHMAPAHPNTVRRRLSRMLQEGELQLSADRSKYVIPEF